MNDSGVQAGSIGSAGLIGWQTLLADLSLILFMVTAAAISSRPRATHSSSLANPAAIALKIPCTSQLGEPSALWRAGGSQTLARWLATQQPDVRQQLTITANYRRGGEARALAAAQALVAQAGALGRAARVIVAPATQSSEDELLASLAYDQPPAAGTAQGLRTSSGIPAARTTP